MASFRSRSNTTADDKIVQMTKPGVANQHEQTHNVTITPAISTL